MKIKKKEAWNVPFLNIKRDTIELGRTDVHRKHT